VLEADLLAALHYNHAVWEVSAFADSSCLLGSSKDNE
jgi:hypothetical protein